MATITKGAGAGGVGSSAALLSESSDSRGFIEIVTGLLPTASAVVATVTFSQPYEAAPVLVILTPANAAASSLAALSVFVGHGTVTAQQFTLTATPNALIGGQTLQWAYHVKF